MKVHQQYKIFKGKTSTDIYQSPMKYSWRDAWHQLRKKPKLP